ncbi:MAG: hypothetical protein ACI4I6_05915 [Hominimerdicola sp.]
MNTITKKAAAVISAVLTLAQCGGLSASAVDTVAPYSGEMLIAVNTSTKETQSTGSLADVSMSLQQLNEYIAENSNNSEIVVGYDGNGNKLIDPQSAITQLPIPTKKRNSEMFSINTVDEGYDVGDTKALSVMKNRNGQSMEESYESVEFEVLYSGDYCTVWAPTNNSDSISSSLAEDIGNEYDKNFPKMEHAFGSPYDLDGDGKVALVCYDIDRETPISQGYVAGFFTTSDFYSYSQYEYTNCMDMIHIDTKESLAYSVQQVYDTIFHELQHLINFSYFYAAGGYDSEYVMMPTYLNEAFAEAASHLIYGLQKTEINYFNKYINNHSLASWQDVGNYALSYLFSQYVRTQYGDTSIYKDIIVDLKKDSDEYLENIAAHLNVDVPTLIQNFYVALYLKDSEGPYGFMGESWANDINPKTTDSAVNVDINQSAAIYVPITSDYTPVNAGSDIRFISVGAGSENTTKDISECTISLSASEMTYTGSAVKPKVTVKDGTKTLISGTDYVVRYIDNVNVGTASVKIAGKGDYTGSVIKTFSIIEDTSKNISDCTITLSKSSVLYSGNAIKPKVTVKDGSKTLVQNTDYVIRYTNNVNVGTASVIIAGKGDYVGRITKTFEILAVGTKNISNCTITLSKTSMTYTGSSLKPKVTVKDGSKTLSLTTDYVVRYVNNVAKGTASVVISGRGDYTGTVTKTFTIV